MSCDAPVAATAETTPGRRARLAGPAGESIELEPEDRLALDPALELGRAADRQDPAAIDDRDPLAQLVGLGHVVGGQQDGPAGHRRAPADHQLADRAGGRDVQAQGGLVEEEDPRVVEQAAGEVHLLALAGRQGAHPLVALLAQADGVDQLVHPAPALARAQAVELAEHPELLARLEDAVARLLAAGDHVHDPADLLGLRGHVEAEDPGGPRGRQQERGQDLDQGGLAGAVGPEQAEELARGDLQVDPGEGGDIGGLGLVHPRDPADVDRGSLNRAGHGTASDGFGEAGVYHRAECRNRGSRFECRIRAEPGSVQAPERQCRAPAIAVRGRRSR